MQYTIFLFRMRGFIVVVLLVAVAVSLQAAVAESSLRYSEREVSGKLWVVQMLKRNIYFFIILRNLRFENILLKSVNSNE